MCFRSKARKVSRPWTSEYPGRAAAASRCSWNWPVASCAAGQATDEALDPAYRRG